MSSLNFPNTPAEERSSNESSSQLDEQLTNTPEAQVQIEDKQNQHHHQQQPQEPQHKSLESTFSNQEIINPSLNQREQNSNGFIKNDDTVSPSPKSPEPIGSLNHQKPKLHEGLILKVSQGSQISVPIPETEERRPKARVASVTTKGGRVIRNISMNNSVKYNIGSAYEKYGSAFSSYKNIFRQGSHGLDERAQPSLRKDGQVRRASRHERTDSDRSSSVSSLSSLEISSKKKNPKLLQQESTESCTSVTSNTQLVANPYNSINQKINSVVWCPCFFFFCFLCCLPAIRFMNDSDKFFENGQYEKARLYARISTFFYILGILLSVLVLSAIFAIIIIFAK